MRDRTTSEKYSLTIERLRDRVRELDAWLRERAPIGLPPVKIQLEVEKATLVFAPVHGLFVESGDQKLSLALSSVMVLLASVGHLEQITEYVENALHVQVADLEQAVKVIDNLIDGVKGRENTA